VTRKGEADSRERERERDKYLKFPLLIDRYAKGEIDVRERKIFWFGKNFSMCDGSPQLKKGIRKFTGVTLPSIIKRRQTKSLKTFRSIFSELKTVTFRLIRS
jgi:hypothetical protein